MSFRELCTLSFRALYTLSFRAKFRNLLLNLLRERLCSPSLQISTIKSSRSSQSVQKTVRLYIQLNIEQLGPRANPRAAGYRSECQVRVPETTGALPQPREGEGPPEPGVFAGTRLGGSLALPSQPSGVSSVLREPRTALVLSSRGVAAYRGSGSLARIHTH